MMKNTSKHTWLIWMIIGVLVCISLACANSGVAPNDPRLQPPLSTIGLTFEDFLKQLNAIPGGGIMAPWITVPGDTTFNADSVIEVHGWAPFFRNAELVIYEIEPDATLSRVVTEISALANTTVDETTKVWQTRVTLPKERQYLAARLERSNGKHSPFSNIIYISRGDPAALLITSPEPESVITTTLTLKGTGEPRVGLNLAVNGETLPLTTAISEDGTWVITDIPLTVSGFDAKSPSRDRNRNEVSIMAQATGQTAGITVRRIEPIRLLWPFRKTEGEKTVPDFAVAQVSAFFNNDWHFFEWSGKSQHQALDITSGKATPLYAVADGTVVAVDKDSRGSNYIIVDSGGWGVLYLHIAESAYNARVKVGDEVVAGQFIATEGGSGGFPIHLHIEARVWGPDVNRNSLSAFFKQTPINLNPSRSYWEYFQTKRIDLYDRWGGDDYCPPDGCWADVDWRNVKLLGYPAETYPQGCWNDKGTWTGGSFNGRATRARYCQENPSECPCSR